MIEFFDRAGKKLAERFAAAEDFSSLLFRVLTVPGFHVEGYTGDFLEVYQVIRSWHGDWEYNLKMTADGRFILISRGWTVQTAQRTSQPCNREILEGDTPS